MEHNSTSENIITRAIDFYSWTLTFSGESFIYEQINLKITFELKHEK